MNTTLIRNRFAAPNNSIDKHDFHLCFLKKAIIQNLFQSGHKNFPICFSVKRIFSSKFSKNFQKSKKNNYLSQFIISFHLFSLIKNKRLVVPVAILEVIKIKIGGKLDNVTFTTVYQLNILKISNIQYHGTHKVL